MNVDVQRLLFLDVFVQGQVVQGHGQHPARRHGGNEFRRELDVVALFRLEERFYYITSLTLVGTGQGQQGFDGCHLARIMSSCPYRSCGTRPSAPGRSGHRTIFRHT